MQAALSRNDEQVGRFFKLLALCHTVRPEVVDGKVEYQAESPDEKALTEAARETGFVFLDTTPEHIIIDARGQREQYTKLALLAFNSDRKRMTVVLRAPDNSVLVLCKGADTIMFPLLRPADQGAPLTVLQDHLDNSFAKDGLRTLVLAQKTLSESEYADWIARYQIASTATPEEKEKRVAEVAALLECNFELVGASAIEDKLQVPSFFFCFSLSFSLPLPLSFCLFTNFSLLCVRVWCASLACPTLLPASARLKSSCGSSRGTSAKRPLTLAPPAGC
jgi:magnesium-transporting ATPase (P-type)